MNRSKFGSNHLAHTPSEQEPHRTDDGENLGRVFLGEVSEAEVSFIE
ncbi:hypothetical protein [Arenicella xantha]|nr:hypothetical protein [Arenicella xantha]